MRVFISGDRWSVTGAMPIRPRAVIAGDGERPCAARRDGARQQFVRASGQGRDASLEQSSRVPQS
jgi:hypothetical protein